MVSRDKFLRHYGYLFPICFPIFFFTMINISWAYPGFNIDIQIYFSDIFSDFLI